VSTLEHFLPLFSSYHHQPCLSPLPTMLITTTALRNCPQMPMSTNDHTATTTRQKTKTAAHKQRQPPINNKMNHGHDHHPPQPTNDSQHAQMDTGDADWQEGTRDDNEGQGTMMTMIIIIIVVLYLILWAPLTSVITPQLMWHHSTAHLVTPPQWEGLPPCHCVKQNKARQQGHKMMDDKQPTMTNDTWQWTTMNSKQKQQTVNNNDGHH